MTITPPTESRADNGEVIAQVLVLVDRDRDEQSLVMAGSVLASWFGASIQLLTTEASSVDRLTSVSAGLGVEAAPVAVVDPTDPADTIALMADCERPLLVASADGLGLPVARANEQPTFLAAGGMVRRMASGPLVVAGADGGVDALALATLWATTLVLGVRLVVDAEASAPGDLAARSFERLRRAGVDVGVDSLRSHGLDPTLLVARTRGSTAVVVPTDALDDEMVHTAVREGVSVLVAPPTAARSHGDVLIDLDAEPVLLRPGLASLGGRECVELLRSQSVARLGYVDHGWPVVTPINYLTAPEREAAEGVELDIVIRSLDGGKLRAAMRHDVVCLEVDGLDPETRSGWSILAHGHLSLTTDPALLRMAWEGEYQPWIDDDTASWLLFTPFALAGRRVGAAVDDAATQPTTCQ